MATYYEMEEIKQQQVMTLLQVRAKYNAVETVYAKKRESSAEILKSPFGIVQAEGGHVAANDADVKSAPAKTLQQTSVATHSIGAEHAAPSLFISGVTLLIALVILGFMSRHMWDA